MSWKTEYILKVSCFLHKIICYKLPQRYMLQKKVHVATHESTLCFGIGNPRFIPTIISKRFVQLSIIKYYRIWYKRVRSEGFLVFHLLSSQRDISSMWQGSWMCLGTVTSLFCSFSRVTGWCLLKRITKQACSTNAYLNNFLINIVKNLRQGLFCESSGITIHSLIKVKFHTYALLKICWKRWLQH